MINAFDFFPHGDSRHYLYYLILTLTYEIVDDNWKMRMLLFVALSLVALASSDFPQDKDGVLILDTDNFDAAIAANEYILG